jgi:RNA recognition motif-containing protein
MSSKIYVGNVPFDATEEGLRGYFEKFGTVELVTIIVDRLTGKSRGFGFVQFFSELGASRAIDAANGQEYQGRNLRVSWATERRR